MFVLKKSIWSWCLNSNYHLRHQSLLLRISKSQQLSSSTNIEQSFERIEDTVFKSLCDDIGIKSSVESVILSISGGVDSMAMLHIFAKIRSKFKPPLSLYVVNFNHKVRMESDEEVEFVRKWSNHYSIPFFTREFPIEFRNLSSHFQVRARKWRQEQYVDIINNDMMALMNENVRNKEFLISTAHHNDDQLETVLFNFFRGIHLTRIHGMNGRNSNGYIKPLLALRKDDLIEYMTVNGYPWREDQSNSEVSYTRNFIRHKIIPELNYLAGSKLALEKRIAHMIQQSKEMHELLSYESNDFMNNYVRYSCEMESDNNSNEINPSSHHDAYLIAMINVSKNAKFNQLPSIIRSYIIHQICYRLYQSPQQVLSKMGNDNINNDDESDDYDEMANEHDTALPYEMIVRLRDVAEQALLSDQKTKYIDINKHMFAVRSGTLMQFKRRLNAEEFLWVNTFSDQQRAQRSFAVNDNIVVTYDEV
jgi:tRNA(Ile)-lysidine synthetase-like protein